MTIRAGGRIDVQDKVMGGEDIKTLRGEIIAAILKSPRKQEKSMMGEIGSGSGMRISNGKSL